MKWTSRAALSPVQPDLIRASMSLLPHQASVEHQLSSHRGVMAKRKSFHPGAILQDQVGCLSLGGEREQVMSKLSPKNNTFSFYETGWRRPKTLLGKKCGVEITEEGRRVVHVQPGAGCRLNANNITSLLPVRVRASKKRVVQTAAEVWCTFKLVCQGADGCKHDERAKTKSKWHKSDSPR